MNGSPTGKTAIEGGLARESFSPNPHSKAVLPVVLPFNPVVCPVSRLYQASTVSNAGVVGIKI
jgi:hypothetical protein